MQFNSIEYVIFFPLVAALYFTIPRNWQWLLLVAAGYVFYMAWKPAYLLLILATTVVDYTAALAISRAESRTRRRALLAVSIACNLGLLFSFKYFSLFARTAQLALNVCHVPATIPVLNVLLPVGISFYTFQSMSYTIDVFLGRQEAERRFGRFAQYVAFFPQLVAGPIERARNLLPQLNRTHSFDAARAVSGLRLILWGLFKKAVIADRLASVVDRIYAGPVNFEGPVLVAATLFFTFQIYLDFSAYTDIATGSARFLGVDLMKNFDRPYAAKSIPEFWRRWHISLSTWFRDYVYIPLGGNQVPPWRHWLNLFTVFTVSGLWHGAHWTFVAWGMLHGAYYLGHLATARPRAWLCETFGLAKVPRLHGLLQNAVTFALVCAAWIVFRANSLWDAAYVLVYSFRGWGAYLDSEGFRHFLVALRVYPVDLALIAASIAVVEVGEWLRRRPDAPILIERTPRAFRWAAYAALALCVMNLGIQDEIAFIYFQF